MSDLGNMLRPLASRIGNMLARGRVSSVKGGGKMQVLQLQLLDGEVKDRLEHFEPYGFTSNPKPGAEAAAAFLDGDRSHGIVLVVADRRFRLTSLVSGEVAIHDDLGQKVHLTRSGIVIDGAGLPIVVQNTPTVNVTATVSVTLTTPDVFCTGKLTVAGNTLVKGLLTYEQGLQGTGAGQTSTITGNLAVQGNTALTGTLTTNTGAQFNNGTVKHNAKTIGDTHTHGGVAAGGASTAVPN